MQASRRSVSDKTNFSHFFGLGIATRYPKIDEETIAKVIELPDLLLQDGFLSEIENTNPDLRKQIT